ncbi:MAG: saccharopine dehydrogenase NADP-binding domain-containing protein, partial [Pseudomonadota bacterium]
MPAKREFDIVVWGATGFTGRLVAEHLADSYGLDGELSWAIGGRNADKLTQIGATLERDGARPEVIVGDAGDVDAMQSLAERTRVVATTVGPYSLYGNELVAACARTGTHYCDLAGEVPWVRRM